MTSDGQGAGRCRATRDRALRAWVEAARSNRVVDVLMRRNHYDRLRRSGHELVGPCPVCAGHDRFAVHPGKNLWHCRGCDRGGDTIALVRHVESCDFWVAVEILTGEPAPGHRASESESDRRARLERQAAMLAEAEAKAARQAAEQNRYRDRERRRCWEIWSKATGLSGSIAELYLAKRGLTAPRSAQLRCCPNLPLWDRPPPAGQVLHRGPAMVAAIEGPSGRFAGLHMTWIDLKQPKGKACVVDPATGEVLSAKKVRGSKRGGSILLGKPQKAATQLFLGEGNESVLSVREALVEAASPLLEQAEFRSAIDLGNLAGRAAGREPHPSLMVEESRGRGRRLQVPNGVPHPADRDGVITLPGSVSRIVLIGDGDSEPFMTRLAMERSAARYAAAYPWVQVALMMPPAGTDFNVVWMASRSAAAAAEAAQCL